MSSEESEDVCIVKSTQVLLNFAVPCHAQFPGGLYLKIRKINGFTINHTVSLWTGITLCEVVSVVDSMEPSGLDSTNQWMGRASASGRA